MKLWSGLRVAPLKEGDIFLDCRLSTFDRSVPRYAPVRRLEDERKSDAGLTSRVGAEAQVENPACALGHGDGAALRARRSSLCIQPERGMLRWSSGHETSTKRRMSAAGRVVLNSVRCRAMQPLPPADRQCRCSQLSAIMPGIHSLLESAWTHRCLTWPRGK